MARLALEQANDDFAQAQAAVQRILDAPDSDPSAVAVRAGERKVAEATLKVEQVRAGGESAQAGYELERQRAQADVQAAQEELQRAQIAERRSREEAQRFPPTATVAAGIAERRVAELELKLAQLRADLAGAVPPLERARQELNQAREQLVHAQREASRAESTRVAVPVATAGPSPTAIGSLPTPTVMLPPAGDTIPGTTFAVREAQRRVAEAGARYEQLRAVATLAPLGGASGPQAEVRLVELELEQARDELARAQVSARWSQEDIDAGYSTVTNTLRAAERRLADATAKLRQLEDRSAQGGTELRLAQLALDQANDDLAQARVGAQRTLQQGREAAHSSYSTAALALRSAERKVAEATLKLQQVSAVAEAAQNARDNRRGIPELQVTAAQAALGAAEAKLRELQSGASSLEMLQNEERRGALLLDEAVAARSAAQPIAVLAAPFDGTVTAVDVAVNQIIEPKTPVLRLDDPNQLAVVASASESDVSRLTIDEGVDVTFPGVTDDFASGKISQISGAATRQGDKISFPVRVDLGQLPVAVRLGMTASVGVTVREARDILHIPTSATRTVGNQILALRVRSSGDVDEIPVAVGSNFGSEVEIVSGLQAGDTVGIYTPPAVAQATARPAR